MSEKILELFDLLFTFILIGSLIREIPAVKKMLITAEDALELGSKVLPKKTDHELILWFSRAFGFISLFFFILFLISPYLASKFSLQINPNLQLSLILIFIFFAYLWMSLHIAKPTKEKVFKYLKSNAWILSAPFLFLGFDLLLNTNILSTFGQKLFNLFFNIFGYYLPDQLFNNFFAFFTIFYTSIILYCILIWLIALPPYFFVWLCLKIFKHKQKQERFLFLILLAFVINKLVLIFAF